MTKENETAKFACERELSSSQGNTGLLQKVAAFPSMFQRATYNYPVKGEEESTGHAQGGTPQAISGGASQAVSGGPSEAVSGGPSEASGEVERDPVGPGEWAVGCAGDRGTSESSTDSSNSSDSDDISITGRIVNAARGRGEQPERVQRFMRNGFLQFACTGVYLRKKGAQ